MTDRTPLTFDDIPFATSADWPEDTTEDGPGEQDAPEAPARGEGVEQAPTLPHDGEDEAAIKRKFNVRLKEIEGKDDTRADRTLSEIEMAEDWMATEPGDRYLHAEGVGWRRYEKGLWTDGAHDLYQNLAAFIRERVEGTTEARSLNKHSVVRRCAVERRRLLAGANPARQLSLQPVAIGAGDGGNDMA